MGDLGLQWRLQWGAGCRVPALLKVDGEGSSSCLGPLEAMVRTWLQAWGIEGTAGLRPGQVLVGLVSESCEGKGTREEVEAGEAAA